MKEFAVILFTLLAINIAQADPYSMAKQQARNVANGQPISSQRPPAPPPQNNNQPANPELVATLRNIANLRADFTALNSSTNLDSDSRKASLMNNLNAAPQGAYPSATSVKKLADDLVAATIGKEKMRPQQQKLAQDIHAIFNSSHLSTMQQQTIFDDAQKILNDGGATPEETEKVVADLKEIAAQTK